MNSNELQQLKEGYKKLIDNRDELNNLMSLKKELESNDIVKTYLSVLEKIEEFEEQYSEKNNSSREKNYDWIIALQNVSAKYTREYMFKQISEREDIISKKLQEIEDRQFEEEISLDEYFDEYEFEIGHVGNKVKVKK